MPDYAVISPRQALDLLAKADPDRPCYLDLETYGSEPALGLDQNRGQVRLVSFLLDPACAPQLCDLRLGSPDEANAVFRALSRLMLVCHNAMFDLGWLIARGHFPANRTYCTSVLARLVLAGERKSYGVFSRPSLQACCKHFLGLGLDKEQQTSDWGRAELTREQLDYASRDVQVLPKLFEHLRKLVVTEGLAKAARIEMEALPIVAWANVTGIPFDQGLWAVPYGTAKAQAEALFWRIRNEYLTDAVIAQVVGPRYKSYGKEKGQARLTFARDERALAVLNSPTQLGHALSMVLHQLVPSTNDDVLAELDHPLAELVRDWREAATVVKMFGPTWGRKEAKDDDANRKPSPLREGRLHPNFYSLGTDTGRMKYDHPNVTQVPAPGRHPLGRAFREAFRAPMGRELVIADFCLTGDTPIVTIDGVRPLIDVVVSPSAVLSLGPQRRLEFREVERAALIGVLPVMRVTFEDGSSVRCTADHEWIDRNGTKVKTRDLYPGYRLEHVHDGWDGLSRYPTWYVRSNRDYVKKHQLVAAYILGPYPEGCEIDHIDGDVNNWAASNLRYLPIGINRGQGAGRWWAKASAEERQRRIASLVQGQHDNRRSYGGAGNPNYGRRKGAVVTCPTCGTDFYAPPSRKQKFCSIPCRGSNHCVVAIAHEGIEPVYHLTVAENHNYVLGNGLVSANSQIELRLGAQISGDKAMREVYERDEDIHTWAAQRILGVREPTGIQRTAAKIANFGLLYGAGAERFRAFARAKYGVRLTPEQAEEIRQGWFLAFPGVRKWQQDTGSTLKYAGPRGLTTRTLAGRSRKQVGAYREGEREAPRGAYSEALNSPVQGSGADLLKLALGALYRDRANGPGNWKPILFAHDEVVVEVDEGTGQAALEWLVGHMVRAGNVLMEDVPTRASGAVSKSWLKE